MKQLYILAFTVCAWLQAGSMVQAADVVWFDGHHHVGYVAQQNYSPVVKTALGMFADDMLAVTGLRAKEDTKGRIEIIELSTLTNKEFKKLQKRRLPYEKVIARKEAFYIGIHEGRIVVMGDDGRGTAYGILELSRLAGVSPWVWWGDVVPERKDRLTLPGDFQTMQRPSVEFRGIFINDEDWSLRPWMHGDRGTRQHGHKATDDISPAKYRKVFELLLRLRANTIWPAMHEGTTPFFQKKGGSEVADSFGIVVGSSHCEPMLRNNVGEWNPKRMGDYNFFSNRQRVLGYWRERVEETSPENAIYTLGMRGIHDGAMEGAHTLEEKVKGLSEVISEQRNLLRQAAPGHSLKEIPQVFIPYKEVLDIYESGVDVPDDVMLMWCDDNYGYITRLPDSLEQQRPGGNAVYYHLSYWGRPHDYLWLSTTQPGLLFHEMQTAWNHQVRRLWMVNVHDPKVAAYQLSLFLDMAWNIDAVRANTLERHLEAWLQQQFGTRAGHRLLPVMRKFYQLTSVRRPEFMGWSQVELDHRQFARGFSPAADTEFNPLAFGNELERYLSEYQQLRQQVDDIGQEIPERLKDAYFASVKYPVFAASAMATKQLEAQEARHIARPETFHHDAEALTSAARSIKAWRELQQLTDFYNRQMAGGKWDGIMSMQPRRLPVFDEPTLPDPLSESEIKQYATAEDYDTAPHAEGCVARNAADYTTATDGTEVIPLLGHSMCAVALPRGGEAAYQFSTTKRGKAVLRIALIPTHAVGPSARGGKAELRDADVRFSVAVDDGEPTVFSLREPFRSDRWKQQVLRQQAVRELPLDIGPGTHRLTIRALDDHIILDQWMLDFNPNRRFYRFPL